MKELFNFPQKKGKNFICHPITKTLLELNGIKINNFQQLNDKNGYFIECNIPINNNEDSITTIKELDNNAKTKIIANYNEWFENDEEKDTESLINNLYVNSYNDNIPMTIILSNKIETEIIINDEEKEQFELVNYLNENKKNTNYIINIDIIFLGIYINKTSIINKWAIKYINIESVRDNSDEWNRQEIEEEWEYDLITLEEDVAKQIAKLQLKLKNVKELYNEIKKEPNMKNWENKLNKLKSLIFQK